MDSKTGFMVVESVKTPANRRSRGILAGAGAPTTMKFPLLAFTLMLSPMSCIAAPNQPVEAGKVAWGRDLDTALAASKATGRPVFALFQEIPGCAGCQQFGRDVLSNAQLVEAIETEFTPLLIHNNKPGKDAEVLRRFGEPAWNYQVVRFLDAEAKDIIPRRDQVWDTAGITERMMAVLEKAKRPVPAYLKLLAMEHSPRLKQAVFSMYCFWTGEMALGQLDGVVTTEAGFMSGREVVLVRYEPAIISLPNLIAAAEKNDCHPMETVSAYRPAPADDQKKQLGGTKLEKLPLSAAQAAKVNAWLRVDASKALSFLTQAQAAQLK
jgi:hypothetical protein